MCVFYILFDSPPEEVGRGLQALKVKIDHADFTDWNQPYGGSQP